MAIHPTAIIHDGAKIDPTAEIGPFCTVGSKVSIGPKVKLHSHVMVEGNTTIGEGTEIYPFAVIGANGQSLKFIHESGNVTIGKNNIIREHVTVHVGTKDALDNTIIGDNNLIMVNCHIAHDCIIHNNVVMANLTTLAGHIEIFDNAILGGLCAVHQFCRIGRNAMVGAMSGVAQDIIPFGMIVGDRGNLTGLNLVGMRRHNISNDEITNVRKAYDELFGTEEGTLVERRDKAAEKYKDSPAVMEIINFMKADSKRGIMTPKGMTDGSPLV